MGPWGSETQIRARSPRYDRLMWSLLYLVVRALVRLLVRGGRPDRDDGSKDLVKGSISRIRGAGPVACALRYRKEFHAVLAPVPPGPPTPRSRRSSNRGEGHRAPGAPPPGEGAPAAGEAPATQPTRPSPAGGREPGDDEDQLVLVHRAAGDPAALASGTRPEEVDIQEDRSPRSTAGRRRCPGPHRPARPREPPLGVPADPRRDAQARDQDLRDDGPDDPAPRRARPSSPPGRPDMDRVPAATGGGDPRDRLLHRRDDQPQNALRPVLHRALDPARVRGRRHREPRLRLGYPAGAEPRHRGAAVGCPVPTARPGRQVLGTLRCGASSRGRPDHPNADPCTSGECLRGAVRG